MGEINPKLLKPHPKNNEYYNDLSQEKYEEIKRSIAFHGIRDPLKVLPDYTIISGHQRYRIALELGLEKVPIEIKDISPEEAEYLLIAENEERRQSDDDPMKKARRAAFLKEYWGVRQGPKFRQNGEIKTAKDIAEVVGVDVTHLNRLLKLNDLIPEFQAMVSSGKLGTSAAEQVAYLSPEAQAEIYRQIKEQIADMTVAEVKDLRKKVEEKERLEKELEQAKADAQALESRAIEAEDELHDVRRELSDMQSRLADVAEDARREERRAAEEKIRELEEKAARMAKRAEDYRQAREQAEVKAREAKEKYEKAQQAIKEKLHGDIAARDAKIKSLQEQIAGLNKKIAELKSRPPKVVEKIPEDYLNLKQELQKKNEELLALTRSQILQKDRYKIQDMLSSLVQDIGKHMKRAELEISRYSSDIEVYRSVMECAGLLEKAAGEMREWVSLKGGVVDVEVVASSN